MTRHSQNDHTKTKNTRSQAWLPFAVFLVLGCSLVAVLWPLFRTGFFVSDDGEWMVIRLSAFYQSLAAGQFPVRYLGRLNNSYGYPVANFLYPGLLYIGSFLHVVGLSFLDAIKTIMAGSVVVGAVAIFMALRSRFRLVPSSMGALSFIFAPYLLYDLYHRGSVGEVLAIGVAALIFLALEKNWIWLLSPCVALLIISHNTVALIIGVAIMGYLLVHTHRVRMFIGAALGVGAATFFWLPALLEKGLVRFNGTVISDPRTYFVGMDNATLLGFATVISLGLLYGHTRTLKNRDFVTVAMILFGIGMSVAISFPLWNMPYLGQLVQFPYRFLVLPVLLGPWVVALAIDRTKGWQRWVLGAIFFLIWTQGVANTLQQISFVNRPEGFYTTNESTTNVAAEYMPKWVSDIPVRRPVETLEVINGDVNITTRTFNGEHIKLDIEANTQSTIQINKIYYPGWGVTIDSRLIPVNYGNPLGVMQIDVPQGSHVLEATFRETPARLAADFVSVLCVCVYIAVIRKLQKQT